MMRKCISVLILFFLFVTCNAISGLSENMPVIEWTNIDTAESSNACVFTSKPIEWEVRTVLGKHTGEILPEDMTQIKNLDLSDKDLTDISDLAMMTELEVLNISNNSISDISPLAGLTKLEILTAYRNNISDIRVLSGMIRLEVLQMSDNSISDIEPLAALLKLTDIDLSNNEICDIEALSGKLLLERLSLFGNKIEDISPLSNLYNLSGLWLSFNNIKDISVLSRLKKLEYLSLEYNQIADFSPIDGLRHIEYLNISDNPGTKEFEDAASESKDVQDVQVAQEEKNPGKTWECDSVKITIPDQWIQTAAANDDDGKQVSFQYGGTTIEIFQTRWMDEQQSNIIDETTIEGFMGQMMSKLNETYTLQTIYGRRSTAKGIICIASDVQPLDHEKIDLSYDYMGIGLVYIRPTLICFICASDDQKECVEAMNAIVDGLASNDTYEEFIPTLDIGNLKRGDSNEDVTELQVLLVMHNYLKDKADGIFGRLTEEAVRAVQADAGLPQTGEVDAATIDYLQKNSRNFVAESESDALLVGAAYDSDTENLNITVKNMGRQRIIGYELAITQCNESKGALGNFYGDRNTKRTAYSNSFTGSMMNLISGMNNTMQFNMKNGAQETFQDGTSHVLTLFEDGRYARVELSSFTTEDGKKHSTSQTVYARFRN